MSLLAAETVNFRYPQDGRGIEPVSLQIDPGQALYLRGPSGCGKSTLARCLTGLIPHLYRGEFLGTVWLDGLRTDQAELWELSEKAGLVFQNPASQMLAASVEEEILFGLENLGLTRENALERLEQSLDQFDLTEMRSRSPQTLSGGEQQKLALAAMMARRPPLLVLDEPLSMLDTSAAFDFIDSLARHTLGGSSVVICEHRHEYLRCLPDLLEMRLGCYGSPEPLQPPESFTRLPPAGWSLEASDLVVTRGGRTVLDRIGFSLSGGQVIAMVGRNGAGKTTLLRAIAGLQNFEGQLSVCADGRLAAPDFGLVFQNPDLQLFNASVRDEILFRIADPDLNLYAWLLKALNLERYEHTPPLLLSEGEKRRVALAVVLMRQPRHGILLDEPALGQDADHKHMLLYLMRTLAATGKMVIFSTHDIELAVQADHLILLQPDGVVAGGPPEAVLADRRAWQRIGLRVPEWVSL